MNDVSEDRRRIYLLKEGMKLDSRNYENVFCLFTLWFKACDASRIKYCVNVLVEWKKRGAKIEEVMKNMESLSKDQESDPDETIGMMEMIITSASIDAKTTKENACREILKCKAIDIVTEVLRKVEVLIDRNPSVPLSLPDPLKQLQYLPSMDFLVIKITIPEHYQAYKSILLMKLAQIVCESLEESRIVTSYKDNLAAVITNSIYIKTADSGVEGVIKGMELEEQSCLIALGRQSSIVSNNQWSASNKYINSHLQREFGDFLVQPLLSGNDDATSTTTRAIKEDYGLGKTSKTYHCCQESSTGKCMTVHVNIKQIILLLVITFMHFYIFFLFISDLTSIIVGCITTCPEH